MIPMPSVSQVFRCPAPDARCYDKLINCIPYTSGYTRTDVAIELANSQLFTSVGGLRSDKPNVLIVMTDGKTNTGSKPYKTVLAPLKVRRDPLVRFGFFFKFWMSVA